jgi:hypothetical protein
VHLCDVLEQIRELPAPAIQVILREPGVRFLGPVKPLEAALDHTQPRALALGAQTKLDKRRVRSDDCS